MEIPDNNDEGLSYEFELKSGRIHRLSIYLDIEHEQMTDLIVLLYEPQGHRSFIMWKRDSFTGHLQHWFGDKEGWDPNTLNFRGYLASGKWRLHIADYYQSNTGKLNELKIEVKTYQ